LEQLLPFIYGKLLGDGHLEKPAKSTFNSRLKIKHKEEHKEYVKQCYDKLSNYSTKMYYDGSVRVYKGLQKKHFAWTFKTKSLPFFSELRNKWYSDSVKVLPNDLEAHFTKETLAYWYMDDGYVQITGNYVRALFCTDSFTEIEVDRLVNIIKTFDVDCKKVTYKGNFRIQIREVRKFFDLIKEFVPECMAYKIRTPQLP
jgi:hypothetical protein